MSFTLFILPQGSNEVCDGDEEHCGDKVTYGVVMNGETQYYCDTPEKGHSAEIEEMMRLFDEVKQRQANECGV